MEGAVKKVLYIAALAILFTFVEATADTHTAQLPSVTSESHYTMIHPTMEKVDSVHVEYEAR